MNRIFSLTINNFKRIKVVRLVLDPTAPVVRISGMNDSGKSSILDAIQVALVGKSAMPEVPVRVGEDKAEVEVDCGDVVVRRRILPNGNDTLKITTKDGMSPARPQTWLNERIGAISFDPLSFLAEDAPKQAETIRKLAACDVSDIDAKHATVFETRAAVNRELKFATANRGNLPAVADGIPDEETSASDLLAQIDAAQAMAKERTRLEALSGQMQMVVRHNEEQIARERASLEEIAVDERNALDMLGMRTGATIDKLNQEVSKLEETYEAAIERKESECRAVIAELQDKLDTARLRLLTIGGDLRAAAASKRLELGEAIVRAREGAESEHRAIEERASQKRAVAEERIARLRDETGETLAEGTGIEGHLGEIVVPDMAALRQSLRRLEETNAQVRIKARWAESDRLVAALQAQAAEHTKQLEALADERQARIAAVQYPIEGLGFNEAGHVTFDGLPLTQASQSMRLRVAMAIGLAQNPHLRVVLLRDASLLDTQSLEAVCQMAAAADAQVWLERCSIDGVDGEIVIEDGEVAS